MGVTWLHSKSSHAKSIFFGDDKLFVSYNRLLGLLLEEKPKSAEMLQGKLITVSSNISYGPLCSSEAGFVLTRKATERIFQASWNMTLIPFPDIFIAIIAKRYNWTMIHRYGFMGNELKADFCSVPNIITFRPKSIFKNASAIQSCAKHHPSTQKLLLNEKYFRQVTTLVHDHPGACYNRAGQPRDLYFIALIHSGTQNFDRRVAIRNTWGSQKVIMGERIKLLFVLGLTKDMKSQHKIDIENANYTDIIQGSFSDSFRNLTSKLITGWKWVSENCRHAKYYYKGDDDVFVFFYELMKIISVLNAKDKMIQKSCLGQITYKQRIGIYVSETDLKGEVYPPYHSGGSYVLTTDIIPDLYQQALNTTLIAVGDGY
ncbi:lactosylceramide 1,3-N-acetyl-beta-D-glucosaminyltransferase B-like [Amphiura filiformis]|uniref:lactosylceramide 1,3-N-acetyl-beta-D-glucosaminyltransferase B-like n=1 Tax=Amphiura filiformis TaxID=82378 RepID=UPI003B20F436